jgi:hypothetical protein
MADSIRQKIVDAVVTRMALINGSGSYVTTVAHVRDSETNWDANELPAISVFDGDAVVQRQSPDGPSPYRVMLTMPILVRGFLAKNASDAKNARKLIKDIMTAIRQDDQWTVSSTNLVMQSRQVHDGIVRNPDSFEIEACEVEFEVQFMTTRFNAEA